MADLLGAANPVPSYDSANNNRALPTTPRPGDTQIQNIPDPTRVGRPDARTDQQGANDALNSTALRYDSNLQAFLQQLRQAPDLAQMFTGAITWLRGMASTPGLDAGIAEEIAGLLRLLQMDAKQFQAFFLNQVNAGNRFAGPLFSLLRQAYQGTNSDGVRQAILAFAKRYSDFSSTAHIAGNLQRTLRQISDYLPRSWRGQLAELAGRLDNGLQAGTRGENIRLLQHEILPFLGSYVERTHDMGTARTLLSRMMLDMARYENGGEEGLLLSFRQLGGYGDILSGLNQLDDAALLKLLRENSFTRAADADDFARQLTQSTQRALRGEYGSQVREAFQEVLRAFLINESVYMPLNHLVIPLEWDGKAVYSEAWVDPDAEEKQEGQEKGQPKMQFLFKLDVQGLGFVEMTLAARGEEVSLGVYAPEEVARNSGVVAEDLRDILTRHGLNSQGVQVSKREQPLTLTQVFPDLFEGRRSVNVKV